MTNWKVDPETRELVKKVAGRVPESAWDRYGEEIVWNHPDKGRRARGRDD